MSEINPISSQIQIPVELESPMQQESRFLEKGEEMAKDNNFLRRLVDVISGSFSVANHANPSNPLKDGIAWLSSVGAFFSIINGFGGIVTIIKNLSDKNIKPEDKTLRNLETFGAGCDLVNAGISVVIVPVK